METTQVESAPAQDSAPVMDAPATESTAITEGEVSVDMGGSFTSFDDLEGLEAHAEKKAEDEIKAEAAKEKIKEDLKHEETKSDEEKGKEPEKQGKGTEKEEEVKAEGKEDTTGKEPEKEATAEESKNEKVRTIKATGSDGKELELKSDTVFKAKVDGKEEEVNLQDALNSWSGHKAVDRRFNELNLEKKNFLEERKLVDDNVNEIFRLANEGKEQEALFKFFDSLGVDPLQAMGNLRDTFIEEAEKLSQMTPEERASHEANLKAERLEKRVEAYESQEQKRASQAELEHSIKDVATKHSIEEGKFFDVAEELLALKAEGKIAQEVTPELVAQVVLNDRNISKATELLESINQDVAVEDNIQTIVRMLQSGMSDEDIRVFASSKWGESNPAQTLAKKVQKNSAVTEEHRADNKPRDPQNDDVWSFDQVSY